MTIYRGVNNVAREISEEQRGVDNVAREISEEWRGVDNVARQVFKKFKYIFTCDGGNINNTGSLQISINEQSSEKLIFNFGRYNTEHVEGGAAMVLIDSSSGQPYMTPANTPITISYNITGDTQYDGYTISINHSGLPNTSNYPYDHTAYAWIPWYGWKNQSVVKGTFTPSSTGYLYFSCSIWYPYYTGNTTGSITVEITYLKIGDELIIGNE